MEPSAATSATAEPEISAKNSEVPILTIASPPFTNPIRAEAKEIRRWEMPDEFMIAPARMNKGMASSGTFVAPSYMTSARLGRMSGPDIATIATAATTASDTAIGTFSMTSRNRPRNIRMIVMCPVTPAEFHGVARAAPRRERAAG